MSERNREFGRLLREGLWAVAHRMTVSKGEADRLVAEETFIHKATINGWEQGRIPKSFDPEDIERLATCLVRRGRLDVTWTTSFLTQARYDGSSRYPTRAELLQALHPNSVPNRPNVFIAYQRRAEPDATLALMLQAALNPYCDKIFLDYAATPDAKWAERVRGQLQQTDYLIPLLSRDSVQGEIVPAFIEMVVGLVNQRGQPIRILPVRVAFRQAFTGKLRAYLDQLEWVGWEGDEDTPPLVATLRQALRGGALAPDRAAQARFLEPAHPPAASPLASPRLVAPGGFDPASRFYIERDEDHVALEAIRRNDIEHDPSVTLVIKGPRQMGKSMLLARLIRAAREAGKQVGVVDPHLLRSVLADADNFYREFCVSLVEAFDLQDMTEEAWERGKRLTQVRLCTRYVEHSVLGATGQRLVLVIDDAEFFFESPFRNDFFAMLRVWHNARGTNTAWHSLDMILVTSTEPYFFNDDLTQSPFNVGSEILLKDLSTAEVQELNLRHGSPLTPAETGQLMQLLGGHPYLTRQALYQAAAGQWPVGELFRRANDKDGPFTDHLKSLLLLSLSGQPRLVDGLRRVLAGRRIDDPEVLWRLLGAGLVRLDGTDLAMRNNLYASFFGRYFGE